MDNKQKPVPTPAPTQMTEERPISRVYPVIDNDLARDNLENDLPAADLQDFAPHGK